MRTSIQLDADISDFASAYAQAQGISLSAAINSLLRRAEAAPERETKPRKLKRTAEGYLVIAATGDTLTQDMVKATSEDALV